MIIYAESSAVLAWLLGEPSGREAHEALASAEAVTASDLTVLECDRALLRGIATGEVHTVEAGRARVLLNGAVAHWNLLRIDSGVIERARRPFPAEPLRALDAIHLASALVVAAEVAELGVLTFDRRLRRAARELGLRVVPAR